jgi:hypothetical protein
MGVNEARGHSAAHIASLLERGDPPARMRTNPGGVNVSKGLWRTFELCCSRAQQRLGAQQIPTGMVMERRGNLDQALQKPLLVARCREPDFFPHFVCVKEAPRIEELDAARESFDLVG